MWWLMSLADTDHTDTGQSVLSIVQIYSKTCKGASHTHNQSALWHSGAGEGKATLQGRAHRLIFQHALLRRGDY